LRFSGYDCEHPTCPSEAKQVAQPSSPAANPSGKCIRCDNRKSVGGFTSWVVGTSSDGTTFNTYGKPTGNPLMCADRSYYVHVKFSMAGSASYATVDVALGNKAEGPNVLPSKHSRNITTATGISLVYAADKDMYLQVRHGSNKHGGHHYRVLLPKQFTLRSRHFQFDQFAQPDWVPATEKYDLDLGDVFSFTFVAVQSGAFVVSDLTLEFQPSLAHALVPTCSQLLYDQSECVGADCDLPVPSIGTAPAEPDRTPAPMGVDYVLLAAKQAVALENAQYGKRYAMVAVLEGKELRTVGYNYPLKLLVANAGKQMVVQAVVATTTYRDQYRLISWAIAAANGSPDKSKQITHSVSTLNSTNKLQSPTSQKSTLSSAKVHLPSNVDTTTPKIYQATYKQRGYIYPAIANDGTCIELKKPWPSAYVPCCAQC